MKNTPASAKNKAMPAAPSMMNTPASAKSAPTSRIGEEQCHEPLTPAPLKPASTAPAQAKPKVH